MNQTFLSNPTPRWYHETSCVLHNPQGNLCNEKSVFLSAVKFFHRADDLLFHFIFSPFLIGRRGRFAVGRYLELNQISPVP